MNDSSLTSVVPLNDLSRGWLANSREVEEVTREVLKSGSYIRSKNVSAFESEFAIYLGARHVVGVASGSDALELALLGVGCGKGSIILTAPNAGGYATLAALNIGASVSYADVDPLTHTITPESVEIGLLQGIDAVVVTHLYGNVVDVVRIREICQKFNVPVVEDCAQATGAQFEGRRLGTHGDAAAFSFYPTKNLGAAGDAGAVVSNNYEVAERVRLLAQYGWGKPYCVELPNGMNSRLDELQAAILRIGLRELDELNSKRRAIVQAYSAAIEGNDLTLVTSFSQDCAAHLCVIMADCEANRDLIREKLAEAGIQTSVHYPILDSDQVGFKGTLYKVPTPVAIDIHRRIFTVPCFPDLTEREIDYVSQSLAKWKSVTSHA